MDDLRLKVLERYSSVHAFCRSHPELKRATVYLVLSGRYPGRVDVQAQKIREAITPPTAQDVSPVIRTGVTEDRLSGKLQTIRCSHCRKIKKDCLLCRDQTTKEAKELFLALFSGEEEKSDE